VWGRGLTAGGRRRREQVRDLVAAKFGEQYSVPRTWYLLRRCGWTCQLGARRAIERDDGAVGDLGEGARPEEDPVPAWSRRKLPRRNRP